MKIESQKAAKIMKIKWLVLGYIIVRKHLTRYIRFTCACLHASFGFLCTSPTLTIKQIFVTNFGDFFIMFHNKLPNFETFPAGLQAGLALKHAGSQSISVLHSSAKQSWSSQISFPTHRAGENVFLVSVQNVVMF